MAELNFGLLTPPGSQSIGNAFVTGMDQAAVARAQENQNALSQYTLGKAKREDELANQLLGDLRGATTDEQIYRAYQRAGRGKEASELQNAALTRQKLAGEIAAQPGARAYQTAQTRKLQDEARSKAIGEVAGFPDVESALAAIDARLANKIIDQATADQMRRGLTPENFPKWKLETLTRLLTPEKQLEFAAPTPKQVNLQGRMIWIDENPNSPSYGKEVLPPRNIEVSPSVAVSALKPNPVTGVLQNVLPQALAAQQQLLSQGGTTPSTPVRTPSNVPPPVSVPSAALPPVTTQSGVAPANPKQELIRFETNEQIRGSEREAMGKLRVEEYKQLGAAANSARKAMPGIDTAERILNAGFNTGWGTQVQATAANILSSLGVSHAKNYATNAQLFLSQARTVTNDRLLDQKGPQTDNDFKRTEEIGARLGNTADANKFLLAVNRAINKQIIEKHNFFTKWETKNDSLNGAEQAWQDSPAGSASLFDRPELKQYATPAKTTPPDISSAAAAEIARRAADKR